MLKVRSADIWESAMPSEGSLRFFYSTLEGKNIAVDTFSILQNVTYLE
jgi:hypothetical protein